MPSVVHILYRLPRRSCEADSCAVLNVSQRYYETLLRGVSAIDHAQIATEDLTPAGQAVVRQFNVLFSVCLSSPLTQHPSAVGPIFFMLRLALRHAELVRSQERRPHQVKLLTYP